MKKLLLSFMAFSLVSISCVTVAQPTLTSAGTNYTTGTSFPIMTSSYVDPGTSGANQTWNLSSMSGTTNSTMSFVLPSSTTYGSSFPQSNVACTTTGSTSIGYYKTSSTALQTCGSYGSIGMIYSDLEDILRYPCAYNSTYTDPWATQFVSGGYTFYRKGNTTVTADSYGTLITPNGTYTNVMRVHFVQSYQDSAYMGVPYLITYTNNEYMWYKEGINIQIATIYTLNASTGSTYTGGSYLTGSVGINDFPEQQLTANLYPNPANDQVSIEYSLTSNQNVDLRLINSMGQQVKTDYNTEGIQGNNIISLNIEDLPEGIYFAQLLIDGKIAATKRFIRSSKN